MEQPRPQKPGPPKFLTQPKFLLLYQKKKTTSRVRFKKLF